MTEFELKQGLSQEIELPKVVEDRLAQVCTQVTAEVKPVRRKRPLRAVRVGVAAAAICAAMCVGAAAATLAGGSPEFRAMFGVETQAEEALLGAEAIQKTFVDQNGSGASITVREVVRDQESVFVQMDFAAPEGTVLPAPEASTSGSAGYWLWGSDTAMFGCDFFEDEDCRQAVHNIYGWGSKVQALKDEDPTDSVVPLLLRVSASRGIPEEANYLGVSNVVCLCTEQNGAVVNVVDGMDFDLVIPISSSNSSYTFQGRAPVKLGGTTMAVVENLVLSPLSITMDLIIPDTEAYDAALDQQGGAWQAYVLLKDGTRIPLRFQELGGIMDHFYSYSQNGDEDTMFFRADHVSFTPEKPIDLSQIEDIVFVGDNEPENKGPNVVTHFMFSPRYFSSNVYWDKVNDPYS